MHDGNAVRCAIGNLALGQLGHVHGDQALVDQAQLLDACKRTHAEVLEAVADFVSRFVQVQMHRQVELPGQHLDAFKALVGYGVGRMRRETGADQRIPAQIVMHRQRLVEVFVAAARPRRRKLDHRQADEGAEAELAVSRRLHVRVKIVFVAAGGTATDHLGDCEFHAVAHELRPHDLGLRRPHMILQPGHERHVVRQAAHQCHRVVRMGVDQAWNQRMASKFDALARRELLAGFGDRQQRYDATRVDHHRMMVEHPCMRLDRNEPARLDDEIDDGRRAHAFLLT